MSSRASRNGRRWNQRGCWPLLGSVALALFAGCSSSSEPDSASSDGPAPVAPVSDELLSACPRDDNLWARAVDEARRDGTGLEHLTELTVEISKGCPDRWEPIWARGRSLWMMAEQLSSRELLERARDESERAMRNARSSDEPVGVCRSANLLAWIRFRMDDNRNEIEQLYHEAIDAAGRAGRIDLSAKAHNNLARLLQASGRLSEAIDAMKEATLGFEKSGRKADSRRAASNRAVLLKNVGQFAEAREQLNRLYQDSLEAGDDWRAARSCLTFGNIHILLDEREEARKWLSRVPRDVAGGLAEAADVGLGRLALREGDCDEAIEIFDRLLSVDDPDFALSCRAFRAEADLCAGHIAEARDRLDSLIEDADEVDNKETGFIGRMLYGKSLMREGRTEEAVAYFREAVQRVESQGEGLDPMDAGIGYLRERAEPFADLAAALADVESPGRNEEILDVVERAHARALRRVLQEQSAEERSIAGLDQMQAALGPGDLLLDFLIGQERGVVLAVTRSTVRAEAVPGWNDLRKPLARYRAALTRPLFSAEARNEPEVDLRRDIEEGKLLRRRLIGTLQDLVEPATRLYIVPDQDLALLPFAALPLDESGSAEVEGPLRFLGDTKEIAMLPLAGAPPEWTDSRFPLLLAGDPLPDPDGEFGKLPLASRELSEVKAVWAGRPSTELKGAGLSPARLHDLPLESYGTLHFATHAVASSLDPRRCAVIFSGGEKLAMREIADLRLGPALVVLSACRTGEGEVVPGEGVVGLSWAFLRAGARGIAASLWSVEDASTAELMASFHGHLKRGDDPVRAMTLSQRELARSRPHPAYWAPFAVILSPSPAG